jgi:acylpyruvate hydrolase
MKLVTFVQDGQERLGALREEGGKSYVTDLNKADPEIPNDMIAFLEGAAGTRARADKVLSASLAANGIPLESVRLTAPVPRPRKIICIGLNYRDHAAESNLPIPEFPVVFCKWGNSVVGPGDAIVIPPQTTKPDYEVELGVVIGKRARNVAEADALDIVAGYVPFHDVSARDYQMRTSQWTMGKTIDTFGPMGPALVTADEISNPHNLNLKLSIGGEVLQNGNTRDLIFNINQLIADLTAVMTLEPGDLIATGTPAGVGQSRKPPRYLKPGDVVRIEIEKLGVLENPVVAGWDFSQD